MSTLKNKSILIVEDEPPQRNILRDELIQAGFSVLEAKNGVEGLEVALANHPDLILLDLVMPVMDGMTMLKKLRQNDWGATAVVIILTNLISKNNEVNNFLTQTKHTYFLEKSNVKIADVVKKIKERLNEVKPVSQPSGKNKPAETKSPE